MKRRCRKMTKADMLREATRRKGAPLTKMESRALLVEHSRVPRFICQNPDVDTERDEDRADASRGFFPPVRKRKRGLFGLGFLIF